MKKISILTLLALFAATLTRQGAAWAEDFGQIATSTGAWTHITAGSTTGFELKDAYYYVSEDLTFTNVNGGAGQGSGMYVQAGKEVHLYIPKGVTLTTTGANANGSIGAGAGILLPSGSTLHIIGEGTLVATGGNAANGGAGGNGGNANKDNEDDPLTWIVGEYIYAGVGGWGGNGGGGAGAGIGTAGGNGGAGGIQITADSEYVPQTEAKDDEGWQPDDAPGIPGNPGESGTSAEQEMGTLYIQSTITTDIKGGNAGVGGAAGHPGTPLFIGGEIDITNIEVYWVSGFPIPVPQIEIESLKACGGGGGGGGGAGGGNAYAIGTGGYGGGGGGSGACGNIVVHNSWTNDDFGHAGAGGGAGGIGRNDNNGIDGYKCFFKGEASIFDNEEDIKDGGAGGAAGIASVDKADEVAAATAPSYTVAYYAPADTPSKTSEDYNVGSSTTITLPTLSDPNYKWVLSIHGHAAGNTTSHCAAPNGDVFDPGDEVNLSNIYGAIEFFAVYVGCEIDCASKLNNWVSTAWASYVAGPYAVVKLHNRKLYRDGYWNTLTLPFSLDATKLATTCLAGADIRTFKSATWDATNERLTILFSDSNEGKIEAGVPCIIRWGTPTTAPGDVIEDQLFSNVEVALTDQSVLDKTTNTYETASNGLRFNGQIAPVQLEAEGRTLLLGANNKLYKPSDAFWVYATRAYFGYTSSSGIALAREITLDFGNGEEMTTRIDDIMVDTDRHTIDLDGIFNLNGQRLDAPQKGINIINGKKVVIK